MVSSVATNGPSFDTVVDFPRFPAAIKEIIGSENDFSAILLREPSSDMKFRVLVHGDDHGKLAMQEGLKDFMVSNGTRKIDFLVYRNDGELWFHVHVFDPSEVQSQEENNQAWNRATATSAEKRKQSSFPTIYAKEDQMLQARVKERCQYTKNEGTRKIPDFLNGFSGSLVVLFVSFSSERLDDYRIKFDEVAAHYKMEGVLTFLLCDSEASHGAFQYFELDEDQVPVILIQTSNSRTYLKTDVEADEIAPWLKDYMEEKLRPYERPEPMSVDEDEQVTVILRDRIQEMDLGTGKKVVPLSTFYEASSKASSSSGKSKASSSSGKTGRKRKNIK